MALKPLRSAFNEEVHKLHHVHRPLALPAALQSPHSHTYFTKYVGVSAVMFIFTSAGSCLASFAAMCACQACQGVTREVLRKSARLAYCALFTTAMVLAWVLRDFAKPLIQKIPCESLRVQLPYTGVSVTFSVQILTCCCIQGLYTKLPERSAISGMVSRQFTDLVWAIL